MKISGTSKYWHVIWWNEIALPRGHKMHINAYYKWLAILVERSCLHFIDSRNEVNDISTPWRYRRVVLLTARCELPKKIEVTCPAWSELHGCQYRRWNKPHWSNILENQKSRRAERDASSLAERQNGPWANSQFYALPNDISSTA